MYTTYRINPKWERLRGYITRIPQTFEQEGREIYNDRNVIKVFNAPGGTVLNVKRYCKPKGINWLVYSAGIRKPKGERAFIYPASLLSKGVATPEPVAYIEQRSCGMLGYSYFISIQSQLEHTLKDVGDAEKGTYEALADALGKYTAELHEKEILHLDYSPGNILYSQLPSGEFKFALVDINRMYFGKVSKRRGCLNLIRLWGPKRFFILLVSSYAKARGFNVDECVAMALEARRQFWLHYGKKHNIHFKLEL